MHDNGARDKAVDEFYRATEAGDEVLARRLVAEWPEFAQLPDLLIQAIGCRRSAVVADLLAAGASPDEPNELGVLPLVVAAQRGGVEIARMLIEAGAAGPVRDAEGVAREKIAEYSLLEAVAAGKVEAVRRLLAEWPVLLQATEALNLAAEFGHAEVTVVLLRTGVSMGVSEERGETPLATAAGFGRLEIARMLLGAGARDEDGSALRAAAGRGDEALTALLLRAGVNIDARDHHGRTALWEAADSGSPKVVAMLLAGGADVDARDRFYGSTPLLRAVRTGCPGSVTALLEAGADPRAIDRFGLSAPDYLERGDRPEIRAILHGLDPR